MLRSLIQNILRPKLQLLALLTLLFQLNVVSLIYAAEIPENLNLKLIAKTVTKEHKAQILYFSASYCTYCKQLNLDVIDPISRNDHYQKTITISEIMIDGKTSIIDFDGSSTNQETLESRYKIQATPTLVFVDERGDEISSRLTGYQNKDFYWYYLDKSINKALTALK